MVILMTNFFLKLMSLDYDKNIFVKVNKKEQKDNIFNKNSVLKYFSKFND